jgi:hypothetical protein
LKLQADKEGNIPIVTAIDSGNRQLCQELLRGEVEAQTSAFKVFYFEHTYDKLYYLDSSAAGVAKIQSVFLILFYGQNDGACLRTS